MDKGDGLLRILHGAKSLMEDAARVIGPLTPEQQKKNREMIRQMWAPELKQLEIFRTAIDEAINELDPEMTRRDIVELRERLIRVRSST